MISQANRLLRLQLQDGQQLETDIDGTKNIFRKRGWVRLMFQRANAKIGDNVCIKQHEDGYYEVWVDKSEIN